jgi:2-C-methyl-D-erythritol 2,4-cyclodiphosphate synthase
VSSLDLLARALSEIEQRGFQVGNVDAVILAEEPRIAPHAEAMRRNLARALRVDEDAVSVKGKTNEGMDAVGHREGIAAHAVVLLVEKETGRKSG